MASFVLRYFKASIPDCIFSSVKKSWNSGFKSTDIENKPMVIKGKCRGEG